MGKRIKKDQYALTADKTSEVTAPKLAYQPRNPKKYRPNIALIACGGITHTHLNAYKSAGYKVVALCDIQRERAETRAREFYPDATIYTDYRELLKRDDIEVVDIASHPPERPPVIEAAIRAGKHVLSQKPFVVDLSVGEKLCDLADKHRVKLAVNQNGRWSPHFAYMRQAIDAGHIGQIFAAHLSVHWNHNFIVGTPFDKIRHIALYDFGIHWFDIVTTFFKGFDARTVYATTTKSPGQKAKMPLLAQAMIAFDAGQASLVFDADTQIGAEDRTFLVGTKGTLASVGPDLGHQSVTLTTAKGVAKPELQGSWFPGGFHGTMAELLCAIEEKREPSNNARINLKSLALCFAACASADTGKPVKVGSVRKLPKM